MTPDAQLVTVHGLGARGDGVVATPSGPLYIPFALPGEVWQLQAAGPTLQRAHPNRATPLCSHFGTCGGCVAQHMPDAVYSAWKQAMVADAFGHRALDAQIDPPVRIPPGTRRRLTLHAATDAAGIRLGFHEAGSHSLVDVRECPIAVPQIVAALPALREMLAATLEAPAQADIDLLATDPGLDVSLACAACDRAQSARLAAQASRYRFARLTVNGETIAFDARPRLAVSGVEIEPPPGVFLQATEAAERELVRLALAGLPKVKRVADLFCGIGTFTFALARSARVLAVDGEDAAVAALAAAARHARRLKPIETKVRDLFRAPLSARELDGFDAVLFDPPRAGARAQAEEIARSRVPTVVAVSCNPGTLARDARILVDGGYRLERVTPVDQFVFSAHIEAVALFRR